MSSPPLLSADSLEAGYGGVRVVRGVTFELQPGGITALLGPNGVGKTTTLRAISGTARRMGGDIRLGGQSLPSVPEAVAGLGIAHVPQGRRVFSDLTVAENLLVATMRLRRDAASAEITRVMDSMPTLRRLAKRRAGLLSGGEQQMLAIGRAIVAHPKVIMIDELSLGLAPKIVNQFEAILHTLAEEGMSILMVEQFAKFARRVASRLLIMAKGTLVFDGTPDEISEDEMLHTAYLGASLSTTENRSEALGPRQALNRAQMLDAR